MGSLITYVIVSSTPDVYNIFLSLNDSRLKEFPFQTYYFVNYSEKYFYLMTFHFSFNRILETFISISFESVLACSIEHACGLFKKIG